MEELTSKEVRQEVSSGIGATWTSRWAGRQRILVIDDEADTSYLLNKFYELRV
jgi:hypothetical protein